MLGGKNGRVKIEGKIILRSILPQADAETERRMETLPGLRNAGKRRCYLLSRLWIRVLTYNSLNRFQSGVLRHQNLLEATMAKDRGGRHRKTQAEKREEHKERARQKAEEDREERIFRRHSIVLIKLRRILTG